MTWQGIVLLVRMVQCVRWPGDAAVCVVRGVAYGVPRPHGRGAGRGKRPWALGVANGILGALTWLEFPIPVEVLLPVGCAFFFRRRVMGVSETYF